MGGMLMSCMLASGNWMCGKPLSGCRVICNVLSDKLRMVCWAVVS